MQWQPNADPDNPPPPPPHHGFIESVGEGLAHLFLGRNDVPPPPTEPPGKPVVDHQLVTPPYAQQAPEVLGRYQQEVFGVRLNAAGPSSATFQVRTRCDFYTMTCYAAAAIAVDANDGVWVSLSPTPPSIPVLTVGVVQPVPFRLDPGETLNLHGAEQNVSVTLDSTIDLVVILTCNTNVPQPYF